MLVTNLRSLRNIMDVYYSHLRLKCPTHRNASPNEDCLENDVNS